MKVTRGQIIWTATMLLCILVSILIGKYLTTGNRMRSIELSLDYTKSQVLELTAGSTAASAGVTLLPGDVATPIAEKLADISGYFVIVLVAVYLEKFLLVIDNYVAFFGLFPSGFLVLGIAVYVKNVRAWASLGWRLLLTAVAVALLIPLSVQVSSLIRVHYALSINETINGAREAVEEVTGTAVEAEVSETETPDAEAEENKFQAWLDGLKETVSEKVSVATDKMEQSLNRMLEALAVMIVTCCLIPLLVIALLVWIVKSLLRIDIRVPIEKLLPGKRTFKGIMAVKGALEDKENAGKKEV